MVEAVVVISIFVLFFMGMMYFEWMYHNKLRVQQLARAGVVAYAMDACQDSNPLQTVQQDLGPAKDTGSGNSPGDQNDMNPPSTKNGIGNSGGDAPLDDALTKSGFLGDPVAGIRLDTTVATTSNGPGFSGKVSSTGYLSCGDKQGPGNAGDVFSFISSVFPLSP